MIFSAIVKQIPRVLSAWRYVKRFAAEHSSARNALRFIAELAVIPSMIIIFCQLSDVAKSDVVTANEYISHYELKFLSETPWSKIDEIATQIMNTLEDEFGPTAELPKEDADDFLDAFDSMFKKEISQHIDLKNSINKFAAHFRAVLFCVEEGRCDKARVEDYYTKPICHLGQGPRKYIEDQYKSEWDRSRGDLITFLGRNRDRCREIIAKNTHSDKPEVTQDKSAAPDPMMQIPAVRVSPSWTV